MAVLDHIPSLEVTFEMDGERSNEYDDTEPNARTSPVYNYDDFYLPEVHSPLPYVVKYVEAKSGARFQVRVTRKPNFEYAGRYICFKVEADGRGGTMQYSDRFSGRTSTWSKTCDCLVSKKSERERIKHYFRFGDLDVGEVDDLTDADLKKQIEMTKDWGKIVVKLSHVVGMKRRHHEFDPFLVDTEAGNGRTSEKVLKGKVLDTLTKFETDDEPFIKEPGGCHHEYLDKRKRPFAIFEFRYRTKDGLIKEGIIPRPLTPTPDGLVQDDKAPATKTESKRGIKREIDLTDEDTFTANVRPYKTSRRTDGRLEVDLTELD